MIFGKVRARRCVRLRKNRKTRWFNVTKEVKEYFYSVNYSTHRETHGMTQIDLEIRKNLNAPNKYIGYDDNC